MTTDQPEQTAEDAFRALHVRPTRTQAVYDLIQAQAEEASA